MESNTGPEPSNQSGMSGPGPGQSGGQGQSGQSGARPPLSPPVMSAPPPPPFPPPYYMMGPPPPRGSKWGRIFGWSFTGLLLSLLGVSLLFNLYMGIFLVQVTGGPHETLYSAGNNPSRIVILPIEGMIDDSMAEFVHQAITALRQSKPKALILRVDSGGGTVGASDRILDTLQRFQKEENIPIVASFGSVAASGGYYISASADWIVAEPTCITGSIGVMSGMFTVEDLFKDIGVKAEIQVADKSPQKEVANNMFRTWTDEDRQVQKKLLNYAYDRFVEVIYTGRSTQWTTREEVIALADGSVYTAKDAIAKKLVDEEGYLAAAITKAAQLGGVPPGAEPRVMMIRKPVSLGLLGMLGASRQQNTLPDADWLYRQLAELTTPRLEYR